MLALVLGGLLLSGLFCSMVSDGVGAAELTSTWRLGVVGPAEDIPVTELAKLGPSEPAELADISLSKAVICRPVLCFFRLAK